MNVYFLWRLSICFINVINVLQIELERLNTATDDINKLEVDLDVSKSRIKPIDNNIKLLTFKIKYLDI
jgi:SH3 domain-binding protein 5 (SH3BP5).